MPENRKPLFIKWIILLSGQQVTIMNLVDIVISTLVFKVSKNIDFR